MTMARFFIVIFAAVAVIHPARAEFAVRASGFDIQSEFGERKNAVAFNVLGAFDESRNHAFGWQINIYAASDNAKGGGGGMFYRHLADGALWGVNAFADYEAAKAGDFFRYSLGGEWQNDIFDFAANLYYPDTDDKPQGDAFAFSRQGYDARAKMNLSYWHADLNLANVRADYYNFRGKGATKTDDGFRYGMEFDLPPFDSFKFAVLYDDAAGKFGGNLTFSRTFNPPPSAAANTPSAKAKALSANLYTPLTREYTQRITTHPNP